MPSDNLSTSGKSQHSTGSEDAIKVLSNYIFYAHQTHLCIAVREDICVVIANLPNEIILVLTIGYSHRYVLIILEGHLLTHTARSSLHLDRRT